MLKQARQHIVNRLWAGYHSTSPQIKRIESCLKKIGVENVILDHFAIIDLPGPRTGITHLSQLFASLGYEMRGRDYLADKQNDFLWMAEEDSPRQEAHAVLPQVVVADFRLDEMPLDVKTIIAKYAQLSPPSPLATVQTLSQRIANHDTSAINPLNDCLLRYFSGRDWPLPTVKEFHTVQAFNELLAWVLVFGRKPNHFTLSIHLLQHFKDLPDFHDFIETEVKLTLNQEGGVIKGGRTTGIAQSSTVGQLQTVALADGTITLPTEFVEFVWRYPRANLSGTPLLWKDYFTDFVAQHADHVIESLYT